jgi:hypothetical protein
MKNIFENLIDIKLRSNKAGSIANVKEMVILQESKSNIAKKNKTAYKFGLFILATMLIISSIFALSKLVDQSIKRDNSASETASNERISSAKSYFEGYVMGKPDIYNEYFGENAYENDWELNTIDSKSKINQITENKKNAFAKMGTVEYTENLTNEKENIYSVTISFNPLKVSMDKNGEDYTDIYDYMSKNQDKVSVIAQKTTITFNLKNDDKIGKYIISANRHSALDRVVQKNAITISEE